MGDAVAPLIINQASAEPRFQNHRGLQCYGIESYIAVPLKRRDGSFFGTLCTLDPAPSKITEEAFRQFHLFASLIAYELEAEDQRQEREAELEASQQAVSRTERVLGQIEAERALFDAVLRQMPAGVVIAEAPSGRLVLANDQVVQILGHAFFAAEGIQQYGRYQGYHPDGRPYRPEEYPLARSIIHGEVITDEEMDYRRGDGTCANLLLRSTPVRDEHGRIVAAVVILYDITPEKQAAKEREALLGAFRESEERYRSLVTATSQIVWTTNPRGETVTELPTWEAFTGQKADEYRGHGWLNAVHPDDRKHTGKVWRRAVKTRTLYDTEYRLRRSDGEYRYVAARGVPVLEPEGNYPRMGGRLHGHYGTQGAGNGSATAGAGTRRGGPTQRRVPGDAGP